MLKEGHFGLSIALAMPFAIIAGVLIHKALIPVIITGTLIGGNLPDMDTKTWIVKHRGFTHTIWFAGLAGGIATITLVMMYQYIPIEQYNIVPNSLYLIGSFLFGLSVTYGVLTHLLGDMITPRGIRPLDPISPREFIPITISDKKIVYEIRNASDPWLNKGFSLLGVIAVVATSYVFTTTL